MWHLRVAYSPQHRALSVQSNNPPVQGCSRHHCRPRSKLPPLPSSFAPVTLDLCVTPEQCRCPCHTTRQTLFPSSPFCSLWILPVTGLDTVSPPTCSPLPSQEPTPLLDDFMLWNSSIFSTVHQMRPLSALSFVSSYKGLWPISQRSEVFCPLSRVWEEFQHLSPTHSFCNHCPLFRISPNTSLHGAHQKKVRVRGSLASLHLLGAMQSFQSEVTMLIQEGRGWDFVLQNLLGLLKSSKVSTNAIVFLLICNCSFDGPHLMLLSFSWKKVPPC